MRPFLRDDMDEMVEPLRLDGGEHADALVVVVVPDGVDLGRRLQQVGRGALAALDEADAAPDTML